MGAIIKPTHNTLALLRAVDSPAGRERLNVEPPLALTRGVSALLKFCPWHGGRSKLEVKFSASLSFPLE